MPKLTDPITSNNVHSAVQPSTQDNIHNFTLLIDTSKMLVTTNHLLIEKPYLAIIASNKDINS